MLESNTTVEQQQTEVKPQHPYSPTQETRVICEPGDKECLSRLVAAFSDCVE